VFDSSLGGAFPLFRSESLDRFWYGPCGEEAASSWPAFQPWCRRRDYYLLAEDNHFRYAWTAMWADHKSINYWSSWRQWTGMEIIECGWNVQFLVKSQRLSWLNITCFSFNSIQHIHNFQDRRFLILFYKGNSKPLVSVYDFCSMTATATTSQWQVLWNVFKWCFDLTPQNTFLSDEFML